MCKEERRSRQHLSGEQKGCRVWIKGRKEVPAGLSGDSGRISLQPGTVYLLLAGNSVSEEPRFTACNNPGRRQKSTYIAPNKLGV